MFEWRTEENGNRIDFYKHDDSGCCSYGIGHGIWRHGGAGHSGHGGIDGECGNAGCGKRASGRFDDGRRFDGNHACEAFSLGAEVSATATLMEIDRRKLVFAVKAFDASGVIGEGTHVRYIVDREKFLSKLDV